MKAIIVMSFVLGFLTVLVGLSMPCYAWTVLEYSKYLRGQIYMPWYVAYSPIQLLEDLVNGSRAPRQLKERP